MMNKENVKEMGFYALDKIADGFAWLCKNTITVSKDSKEIFTLPILVIALAVLCIPVVLPAVIVSLFCGVEYTFGGENISSVRKISLQK